MGWNKKEKGVVGVLPLTRDPYLLFHLIFTYILYPMPLLASL